MTDTPATNELLALADRLDGWADPVSSGYEVPAAGQVMRDAAEALRAAATPSAQGAEIPVPRVIDNDKGEITVSLNSKELRGWSYSSDQERRSKMLCAREYVEGYCDGRQS